MLGKKWPKNLSCLATWIFFGNFTNLISFVGDGLKNICIIWKYIISGKQTTFTPMFEMDVCQLAFCHITF